MFIVQVFMGCNRVCTQWMEDTEQLCLTGSVEYKIMLSLKDYTSGSPGSRYGINLSNYTFE